MKQDGLSGCFDFALSRYAPSDSLSIGQGCIGSLKSTMRLLNQVT